MTNINRATPTNYQLVIPTIVSDSTPDTMRELTLNIYGTVIPGVSLDQIDSRWQGNKMNFHPGGITFDSWNINFMVDADYTNWQYLFNWLTMISNNYDVPSNTPYKYSVDCTLKIFDNFQTSVMKLSFKNVWIQSLGEVVLSQREGESQVECSATFAYDRFEIC